MTRFGERRLVSKSFLAMLAGWISGLCFTLGIWVTFGLATASHEQFQERLIIRPLRDGKVSSHFSFITLVKDATPRNPETLGLEDDCESVGIRRILILV